MANDGPLFGSGGGDEKTKTLDGVIERIVWNDDESGWSVVRLTVEGRKDAVTAVGNLLGVGPGETVRLRGEWTVDKRFGEQFRFASALPMRPSTLVGIEKYLGSGLVEGIGRAVAARLVAHFGLETLEVIERHGERLVEVEGIGKVRSRRIRDAWAEQRDVKEVMIFLQSHGVSTAFAVRIYKRYGQGAVAVVEKDPYRLALEVRGIGFKTADAIARRLGVPKDAPRRAEAGVLHVLDELAGAGHCYVPRPALVEAAAAQLDVDTALVETAIDRLRAGERVVVEELGGETGVYPAHLYRAETGLAKRLRTLVDSPAAATGIDVDKALAWLADQGGVALAEAQRRAVVAAVSGRAKVLVITGGPGTGKTTIINAILRILAVKNRRILLCAPTGRAAKRMAQATGREARTLHRLLEWSPKAGRFARDADHPLDADMVIVDEASMVDVELGHSIVSALPPACALVLVGDVDQLPSVGPGNVLSDIIASRAVEVVRLIEIFRQAAQSQIVVNAHRIDAGEMPESSGEAGDFFFVEREEPEAVMATVKELVATRIPRRFGLDPVADVQVLVPMNRGSLGAQAMNAELQALLNPSGATIERGARSFRVGDKVMQLRNNYDLDVYNGDVGRIVALDEEERRVMIRFDDRDVAYEAGDLDEVALSYACSIHKSQGSEYPAVVVVVHRQHFVMLARNLLYTAVTRGKRLVVLVGSARAVSLAVRNVRHDPRHTRLAERL